MDLSSLSEDQKQKLEQLQQQFQEHQAQQQQQQLQQQQQQQQQQQEQYQQQQQEQYQQQQQQNQDYASQAYDPSQVQAYEPSQYDQNQAYYSYYQHQQPPQQSGQNQLQHQEHQQQQQQYAYYQSDYANAYHPPQQVQQSAAQNDLGSVQPAGVTVSQEGASQMTDNGGGSGQGQVQHQQNLYYPQGMGDQQQHQDSTGAAAAAYPGLNAAAAAAVAALSQLTQFAGTMDAAERAMVELQGRKWHRNDEGFGPMMGPPGPFFGPGTMHYGRGPMHMPVDRPPFRGGGRRGGGSFRGSKRENFGYRHPRSGGSGPPIRGKGRGRGRGGPRHFPSHGASSDSSQLDPSTAENAELTEEENEPTNTAAEGADEAAVASPSASAPGKTIPNRQTPRVAWCELCRADCITLEILEQHKNGKRHKKNLQRSEELKIAGKPGAEIQDEQNPAAGSNREVALKSENVQESEENKPTGNLHSEAVADEHKVETEQHDDDTMQQSAEETSDLQARNQSEIGRRGTKRKMRGGRGGKRSRTSEAPRGQYEPPKPKVVIPLICDLCNVKCDTQEVFDKHLAGKKHLSKQKRFEGHQAMYGPMVQALYPPNPIAHTLYHPQSRQQQQQQQQHFYGNQNQHFYHPPGSYMPPQAHQPVADPIYMNTLPVAEGMGLYPPENNSSTGNDQFTSATLPDYGATSDNVALPGQDMQANESGPAE